MSHEKSPQHGPDETHKSTGGPATNRKVVLVGEMLLSSKQQEKQKSPTRSSQVSSEGPVRFRHSTSNIFPGDSTHGSSKVSPISSRHISVSSILDFSTVSSRMTPLSEDHILEELKQEIALSADRINQLRREVKQIPLLQCQVDELQKTCSKLANNLQDHQEIIKSLKQRVAVLHEQNSQLGKLVKAQQGGSEEAIAMRNTIMASLAQLKQLQEQVNTIPTFKKCIHELEQARGKEASSTSPQDTKLVQENSRLRNLLSEDMKVVVDQLSLVSQACDGLKKRMEAFENVQALNTTLREHVKRLEAEKDTLHYEIIHLKFHQREVRDVDTAQLLRQVEKLQTSNIQLRNKLAVLQHDARQQKEQLIMKLFEIEALNVKTHKCEVEKRVLGLAQLQSYSEVPPILKPADSQYDSPLIASENSELSPELKIQMLKLEQLRMHSDQSRNMMRALVAERDDLENKVAHLSALIEQKGIDELMEKLSTNETRLSLCIRRNEQLERKMEFLSESGQAKPSAATDTEQLSEQLEILKVECSALVENNRNLEKKCEFQQQSILMIETMKEEKQRAERKYKESREKLKILANELAGSATLLQDYQKRCSSHESELHQRSSEISALRQKYAAAVTELEMAKAESRVSERKFLISAVHDEMSTTNLLSEPIEPTMEREQTGEETEKLSLQIINLQTTLNDMSERLSKTKEDKIHLEKRLEESNVMNCQLQASNHEKEEQIMSKQEEISSLATKIECLEERLLESGRSYSDALQGCRQQLHVLELEKQEVSDRCKKHEDIIHELKQNMRTLTADGPVDVDPHLQHTKEDHRATNNLAITSEREFQIILEKEKSLYGELLTTHEETMKVNSDLQRRLDVIGTEFECEKQNMKQKCLAFEQKTHSANATIADLEEVVSQLKHDLKQSQDTQRHQGKELENMQSRNTTLMNEVDGYMAMVTNLTRQIDQAETREIEHEILRQKVHRLEVALSDSSSQQLKVDNQALITMLQEAVNELPSHATGEVGRSSQVLQEDNLRLEQQVSVLSQWNDKQRQQMEELEWRLDELLSDKESMAVELAVRKAQEGEVLQLRRELQETEQEVSALRRQVRADLQEEMQVKLETQSQIVSVFSEHNQQLERQINELQQQVLSLGGSLTREKAVSPPPFPDPISLMENSQKLSDMTCENEILRQRLLIIKEHFFLLRQMSASVRRHSSTLYAQLSVSIAPIYDQVQTRYIVCVLYHAFYMYTIHVYMYYTCTFLHVLYTHFCLPTVVLHACTLQLYIYHCWILNFACLVSFIKYKQCMKYSYLLFCFSVSPDVLQLCSLLSEALRSDPDIQQKTSVSLF